MSFEKYLRQKQIEKEAKEAASKSVNEVVRKMMRSEFEKYFKENHADSFYSVDAALEMRGDDYIDFHAADLCVLWQHQQSKVDELQKRVDAVKGLIEDLNKCYQQDHQNKFEYWRGFADSAGIFGKRLEQVIRGGE